MKLKEKLKQFRNDRRGIGWVIGVALLSIGLMPIVYFPLDYAWNQVYGAITGTYTFTGVTAEALIVVQLLISYLIIFGLFYTVLWAIIQAKKARFQA